MQYDDHHHHQQLFFTILTQLTTGIIGVCRKGFSGSETPPASANHHHHHHHHLHRQIIITCLRKSSSSSFYFFNSESNHWQLKIFSFLKKKFNGQTFQHLRCSRSFFLIIDQLYFKCCWLYLDLHTIVTFSDCSTSPRRELENNLRMSEIDLDNELIAAGQDEETAFYKVLLPISIIMPHYH